MDPPHFHGVAGPDDEGAEGDDLRPRDAFQGGPRRYRTSKSAPGKTSQSGATAAGVADGTP